MTYLEAVKEASSLASSCPGITMVVVEHRWVTDNACGEPHYEAMPMAKFEHHEFIVPPPVGGVYTEHHMDVVMTLKRPAQDSPVANRVLVAGHMLPLHRPLP